MSLNAVISSAGATAIAEFITFPICTTKTRHQTGDKKANIRTTFSSIFKEEGFRGFYKGLFPGMISQTYSTSSKYFFYRYLNNHVQLTGRKNVDRVANGIVGGVMATTVSHPLDVFKVRMQNSRLPVGNPKFSKLSERVNLRELKGTQLFTKFFYLGYTKTLSKSFVGSCLFFPMYDNFMERTKNPVIASFCTAVVSTSIMQPIDYLKVRQISKLPFYDGFDPRTYYKGFSLNLLRTVPHFTIVMTLTEYFQKRFAQFQQELVY